MTQRQEVWKEAAQAEERRGNDLTAILFALLAQPSEREITLSATKKVPTSE